MFTPVNDGYDPVRQALSDSQDLVTDVRALIDAAKNPATPPADLLALAQAADASVTAMDASVKAATPVVASPPPTV